MAHSDITCISMYCIKKLKKFKNTNTLSIFHKLDISRGKMSSIYNISAFNPDTVTPYSNFSLGLGLPGVRKMFIHRQRTLAFDSQLLVKQQINLL